jgi:hypothetical protein
MTVAKAICRAFRTGCIGDGFRICHFSIQGNHIHLIVEAESPGALARGIHAWEIRVARAINRVQRRRGRVFPDRYHMVVLKTPRQVRNALCYVLQNARRHGLTVDARYGGIDPYSSAWWFTGWDHQRWRTGLKPPPDGPTVAAAESWVLRIGWRRWGAIGIREVPPAAARA